MKQHTVRRFEEQLQEIRSTIIDMGRLAARQLDDATDALARLDPALCEQVVAADKVQDAKLASMEGQVIDLLALRHPLADDLRLSIAALRGARDLERIGDYAKNMAKHASTLAKLHPGSAADALVALAQPVKAMLADVLAAYDSFDAEAAARVRAADVAVDRQYTELFQRMLADMEHGKLTPTAGTHLLFAARCLERIGDHVTNLAEDVVYLVKGQAPADERERADRSAFATGAEAEGDGDGD